MLPLFAVWLNTFMSDNNIIVEMIRDSGIYAGGTSYAFTADQANRLIAAGVARAVASSVAPAADTVIQAAASAKTSGPRRRVTKG